MKSQNFKNHPRFVPLYHYILPAIILAAMVLAGMYAYRACMNEEGLLLPTLVGLIVLSIFIIYWPLRSFPLKAQDRAIRAEENLRHFVLSGKLLDSSLKMSQIVALRFAADEEFVELAARAAKENLSQKDIKLAIKNWKGDYNRV